MDVDMSEYRLILASDLTNPVEANKQRSVHFTNTCKCIIGRAKTPIEPVFWLK